MAADVSVSETEGTQHYGDIVVVGGGCYGSYYVRQLRRAREAGAVTWERLLVVDRNADCQVSTAMPGDALDTAGPGHQTVITRDWLPFFNEYLAAAALKPPDAIVRDAIVPSPLMPHLMSQWVVSRARARWPGRGIRLMPLDGAVDVPWQRAGDDGTHYVSFATWECPINCIEPRTCPHTRGPRAWSLPYTLRSFVETERLRGRRLEGPAVFHCAHRAYGVGMFDVSAVVEADVLVASVATGRRAEILIGTVSHCHGALSVMELAEPRAD